MAIGDIIKVVDTNDYKRIFVNASDYSSLNAACAAVSGSANTIIVSSSIDLVDNLTTTSNTEIVVTNGGVINLHSYNLNLFGPFSAGLYQVFTRTTGIIGFYSVMFFEPVWTGQTGISTPTIHTFMGGCYTRNYNIVVGQPKGWYCTVTGTPGTWVSEGNL